MPWILLMWLPKLLLFENSLSQMSHFMLRLRPECCSCWCRFRLEMWYQRKHVGHCSFPAKQTWVCGLLQNTNIRKEQVWFSTYGRTIIGRLFHCRFLDIVLVFNVDLKRVSVLVDLATVRASDCLLCTCMYILHMSTKVFWRYIFITGLAVNLTCKELIHIYERYTLCITRKCFWQDESFLKIFWHIGHLTWLFVPCTSLVCLAKCLASMCLLQFPQ